MVQRSQFGTAKVKQRDAGRPFMVFLLIGAAGLALFLWSQSDTVEPVVTGNDREDTASVATPTDKKPEIEHDSGLTDWWYDAETPIYDAFDSVPDAVDGSCDGLEYALDDLRELNVRPEAPVASAFSSLINSLDRALGACRSGNSATVQGSAVSARSHLKALKDAARAYGLDTAGMLDGL